MRIVYVYYGNWTQEQVDLMSEFGIELELGADNFEIEKGELHDKVLPYLIKWGFDINRGVGTFYDKVELDKASVLVYSGCWTNGYPQPEDTREWIDIVYDKSGYCYECGSGLIQKAPFRLKKVPNWKNKHTFELEWIYDEIFVKKETYEALYEPLGIEYWPVILDKKESLIENTVQLKIPVVNVPLDLSNQSFEQCKQCGVKKYINQIEGLFPHFTSKKLPQYPMFRSIEYCGTGHSAEKWIFVTQKLRQKIIQVGIRAHYVPVAD